MKPPPGSDRICADLPSPPARPFPIVTLLLKLALAGVLLVSVLSHAGLYVEALDIFSNFRPLYAIACLVLAIPLLLLRQRASGTLALILLAANLAGVLSYPKARTDRSAEGGALTVLTLNLWGANGDSGKVLDLIARTTPDFVLLQELSPQRLDLLRRLASTYPWQTHCAHELRCRVALLSRHPWKRAEARLVYPGSLPLARAEFGPGLGNLLVVNAHLMRPYRTGQRRQLATVRRIIGDWSGPVLLGGDFNATPWSWTLRGFANRSRLRAAGPYRPSWPRRLMLAGRVVRFPVLQLPLDQIWLSEEAAVVSSEHGADIGSDHMPLIVRLRLPEPPVLVSATARNIRTGPR